MNATATPPLQGITAATLIVVAFCETCERLIAMRSLLDDPHHLTRRQGTAMTTVLREGLRSIQRQLDTVRPALRDQAIADDTAGRALAGIGMAMAGLRQVHAHLGYLGARWPLGTADLFVRKLVAEGMPVPVPTLCVGEQPGDEIEDLSTRLVAHLQAIGLVPRHGDRRSPVLALPVMDLLEPLSWPTLLYGLAAAMVDSAAPLPAAAHEPGQQGERYRRACIAAVAARLVGEPTFVAAAVRALLARLSGVQAGAELPALYRATLPFAQPIEAASDQLVCHYYQDLLTLQRRLGAWGKSNGNVDNEMTSEEWLQISAITERLLPVPATVESGSLETLHAQLCDGRPINAQPATLPREFAQELDQAGESERFYALLQRVNERPCTLATILAVGWRYKLRRTYPLCRELMAGDRAWDAAFEALAMHVLERSSLLQQSMEAAYVQQVLANQWRDR